tara:strand:+ start:264 stop:404 length:141 start_codon:yes stop_codon:yes gene_type:complete
LSHPSLEAVVLFRINPAAKDAFSALEVQQRRCLEKESEGLVEVKAV